MEDKKKVNIELVKRIIIFLLLIVIVAVFRDELIDGIHEMRRVSFIQVAGIFALALMYMLIEGYIIYQMSKAYNPEISYAGCVGCAYYCEFVRLVTFGSGAGIGEIYYLSKQGIKPANATGLSLIQYMLRKIAIGVLGGLCFILCFNTVNPYIGEYKIYLLFAVILTSVIGLCIIFLSCSGKCAGLIFRILDLVGRKWSISGKLEKLKNQVVILQSGAKDLFKSKTRLIKVMCLNFCKFFCLYMIPYVLYGSDTELSMGMSFVLMSLATMIAGVIPTPSGYGSIDFCLLILFEAVIGDARVVSLALLYRIVTTVTPAVIGGVVAWKGSLNRSEMNSLKD